MAKYQDNISGNISLFNKLNVKSIFAKLANNVGLLPLKLRSADIGEILYLLKLGILSTHFKKYPDS